MITNTFVAVILASSFHLLPEVEKENERYSIIALVVGVLVAAIIVTSKG